MMSGFVVYLVCGVKIIKSGKNIIFDYVSWVGIKFLVCRGVRCSPILLM